MRARFTVRILSSWLAAVLAAVAVAAAARGAAPAPAPSVAVQLLAFNDLHGNLEPPAGGNGLVHGTPAGGIAYLAAHVARAVAAQPNSIVVGGGDLVGAAPLISTLFHQQPTIEALNAMHLAVSAVGNHELDAGWHELLRLQRGGCHPVDGCGAAGAYGGAAFQYLAANVVNRATGASILPASAVLTSGGVRIGFIGETLRGAPRIIAPSAGRGLRFLDEASTANREAERLERQGVRAVVLLLHEGGRQAPDDTAADPNACDGFSGPVAAIARRLAPAIKVVVSAHTHRFYTCTIDGHLVTSAGSFGRLVTRISLDVDPATDTIRTATAVNEIVTRDVPADPVETALVDRYRALAAPIVGRVVGTATTDLLRDENAAGESALGDVVADAHLTAGGGGQAGGPVVAFVNSGGIRADLVVSRKNGDGRGEVTYGELFDVQPFGNVITTMTMTGADVRRVLEQQFTAAGAANILQVSAGFTYTYRKHAPAGHHVVAGSIAINGRRLRSTDRVRVEAVDFIASGGDGFGAFRRATRRVTHGTDIEAVAAYLKAHSPVAPGPRNRIVRVD